jgi:transcription termination factor NusB
MSMSTIKAQFSDLLRSNMFEVIIEPPKALGVVDENGGNLLKFLVATCDFPFETIQTNQYYALSRKFMYATEVDFDPFNITFLLDSGGRVLEIFQNWKNLIVNVDHKMGYYDDYIGRMTITMIDRMKQPIFGVVLNEVYPTTRTNIQLSYAQLDSAAELSVGFVYNRPMYYKANQPLYSGVDWYKTKSYQQSMYGVVGRTVDDLTGKTYQGTYSPLGSDFLQFNPFKDQVGSALSKIQQQISSTLNKLDLGSLTKVKLPVIGNVGSIFDTSKMVNSVSKTVQMKMNEMQNNITQKYKDLQSKSVDRIKSSISNSISKIFKF